MDELFRAVEACRVARVIRPYLELPTNAGNNSETCRHRRDSGCKHRPAPTTKISNS
jgi:hypothetical protein